MKRLVLSLLLLGVSLFVACGGSGSGSGSGGTNPPPTQVTLTSITVGPASPSITAGATQQFTATGNKSDGTTTNLTSTATWSSANTSVATITSQGGLATGVAAGTSNISATSAGVVGTAMLTVTPAPLVSIAVTPAMALATPNGTQFTATGTYADGSMKDITSSVNWSASSGSITSSGLASSVTPGATATITAASGTISGTATITNPLVSISVTTSSASVPVGYTQAFAAKGTYADGASSVITSIVTWASSNKAVATISNSAGIQGVATGVTAGTTSITATLGSVTSPAVTLTVTNATITSIAVSPPGNTSIPLGNSQQFTAAGTFSDGSTHDITNNVTWSSSDPTRVTIIASGYATGVAVTSSAVTITATDKKTSVQGTATATVNAGNLVSIAITPPATNLAEGTTRQYIATGTFTNGSTRNITNQVSWTSSDPTNATVNTGLVRALTGNCPSSCPVTITATLASISQSVTVSVNNVTVSSITVTPITASTPAGVTQLFTATATFSDLTTQDISANATWSSDNTAVATVNVIGRALAISGGTANITATFGGQSGTAQLTVSTATLVSLAITPKQAILAPGSTVTYQAIGAYSDGTTQFLLATFSSSDPTVVSVVSPGIATGQQAGSASITATYAGVTSNSAGVIVTTSSLASISVTPATASVPFGVSTPFAAIGTFQDGSTQSLTSAVTWASTQSSVATISNAIGQQGVATGISPLGGQTSINAVFAGIINQVPATLTVTSVTLTSIAVTTPTPTVSAGNTANFTAKGTFSDGSVVDLTTQVTWSSSNTTVAVMNVYGQAITASAGTTVITGTFTQGGVTQSGTANLTVQ